MHWNVYLSYMAECKEKGWKATPEGLKAYNKQVKLGLRDKWLSVTNIIEYMEGLELC